MFIILILTVVILCYLWVKHKYSYWKRMGLPYIEPDFPYGNFKAMNRTEAPGFMFQRFYNETKAKNPMTGLWAFFSPCLMINDLEIVKKILIKDFQYFTDRGMYHNEEDDPLSLHLFVISGPKWRKYRTLLTPTFTSGKMKNMFPAVVKVAEDFVTYIEKQIKNDTVIEFKDLFSRFTTDAISSVALGFEPNSIEDPDSEVRARMDEVFSNPKAHGVVRIFTNFFPNIARKLHITTMHKRTIDYFTKLLTDVVEYREKNSVYRKDFLQMLIQLKNKGKLENDERINSARPDSHLSMKELIAQAFVFYLAGFETSSTVLDYIFLELAQNDYIQDRARKEVLSILKNYNIQYTYEALAEMKYLDQIIKETLRIYPPIQHLQRRADADYKETITGITIKKGTMVFIPNLAIARDPEYFPNPMEFDPERFTAEEEKNRNPLTSLGFGDGPRNCIGLRYGAMQTKICLAMLLANFKFTLNSKTIVPVEFIIKTFILKTKGGLWLNVEKI